MFSTPREFRPRMKPTEARPKNSPGQVTSYEYRFKVNGHVQKGLVGDLTSTPTLFPTASTRKKKKRCSSMPDPPSPSVTTIDLPDHGPAYIMENALPEHVLTQIDSFRQSLTLDSKRPTVDRRFFADTTATTGPFFSNTDTTVPQDRVLASILEDAIQSALGQAATTTTNLVYVFRYMRFLEYRRPGQGLDCHTDGTKTCSETGHVSTHTMLLYLTTCREGGETVLFHKHIDKEDNDTVPKYAVTPRRGRILLFPHRAWHQGAAVVDVPKTCLRSEVTLQITTTT